MNTQRTAAILKTPNGDLSSLAHAAGAASATVATILADLAVGAIAPLKRYRVAREGAEHGVPQQGSRRRRAIEA
ncbi:hypothetical protein D3C87_1738340 [compost metagenome]